MAFPLYLVTCINHIWCNWLNILITCFNVTTSWHLHGFSGPMMQGMETVVAVLFPDSSLRQKCWDIRCQWILCIGRLVSKHRHVILNCTLGKNWQQWRRPLMQFHNWSMGSNTGTGILHGWLGWLLPRRALTSNCLQQPCQIHHRFR